MLNKIKEFLQRTFTVNTYQTELDKFIQTYKPQTTAEIEHLVRMFESRKGFQR